MKLILIFAMVMSLYAQDLKQRIEELIVPPQKRTIVQVKYDPFQKGQEVVKKAFETKSQEKTLSVTSILNNKVFINSHWYSVGDEVNGYKIIQIREESVLAKNSEKVVKFGIKRRDNIVKVEDK
jgi:hypothetical protein